MYLVLFVATLMFCYSTAIPCPTSNWFYCSFENPTACRLHWNAMTKPPIHCRTSENKRCMARIKEEGELAAIQIFCGEANTTFCKRGDKCGFDNGHLLCCCITGNCTDRLPRKIIRSYNKINTTTSQPQPVTTATPSVSQKQPVRCMQGNDDQCELSKGGSCFINVNRSGYGWQGCDNSDRCKGVVDSCQHELDGILCCCRTDHCNSFCLLDTGLPQVHCVEEREAKEASHPWLLFIIIGLLLFLIIVLLVLQIVKGQIRRRREKRGRKLVLQATQHWVKNQELEPEKAKPIYAPPAADVDAEIFK